MELLHIPRVKGVQGALDSLHSLEKCREVKPLYNQKGWVGGTNNNNLLNSKFLHSLRSEERVKGGVSLH
jgi:predicted metallopeptidase